ncbi:MAG: beta-glucosidase [Planctomycetota bacterium]|nr:beta-glucosidase [Planctomycetota bacterium]
MAFRKDFLWGAAASSYQIEGAVNEDGRGVSVWDTFSKKKGTTYEGATGEVACDHYHRYQEDVALMKALGLHAYRFSIAWPRILPDGAGAVNERGLDFYSRLVDELLAAGIQPFATLFHWDMPQALEDQGGWRHPESPNWFAAYTAAVVKKLSDRVKFWMPHNEPQCFIGMGHADAAHAPGLKLPWKDVLLAGHHALIAHGKSVQAIRAHAKQPAQVGYAPVGVVAYPSDPKNPHDVAAAQWGTFAVREKNQWNSGWWMDPVFLGTYPDDGLHVYGADVPKFTDADMKTIAEPLDWFGVNIYQGRPVRIGAAGTPEIAPFPPGYPHTTMRWPVTPEALYWGPRFYAERYKLPVYVTENGMANCDWLSADGKVHDPQRIQFLNGYIAALQRAAADGVDVRGYFQWSIMDNYEWAEGYRERFGLVFVDYETQRRIPKDSYYWYQNVIKRNGI